LSSTAKKTVVLRKTVVTTRRKVSEWWNGFAGFRVKNDNKNKAIHSVLQLFKTVLSRCFESRSIPQYRTAAAHLQFAPSQKFARFDPNGRSARASSPASNQAIIFENVLILGKRHLPHPRLRTIRWFRPDTARFLAGNCFRGLPLPASVGKFRES
jgi:hypothetical protein